MATHKLKDERALARLLEACEQTLAMQEKLLRSYKARIAWNNRRALRLRNAILALERLEAMPPPPPIP